MDTADSLSLLLHPQLIEAELQRRRSPLRTLFPDAGLLRRELYPKHLEFFERGQSFKERLFMAANRVGKTVAGAFETTCHLTGLYPHWWQGYRFPKAIDAWACGTDSKTTKEVVQSILLGDSEGMIPRELIVHRTAARGLADSVETVWVQHVSGARSKLTLKTYEQGRRSFEGAAKHFIWCDEEPPMDVYTEMMYRLLTTKGIAFTTFTPLLGRSEVVNSFYDLTDQERIEKSKCVIQAGWAHVPHLDENEKRRLIAGTPAYQIKARTEGEPSLGKGAIYPFPEDQIAVRFARPESHPRRQQCGGGHSRSVRAAGHGPSKSISKLH